MRPLLPYQKLLSSARSLTNKYEQLKSRFSDFADHCGELSKQGLISDIAIEKHLDQGHFDALFVGRRFRFALTLRLGKEGNSTGVVVCSEVLPKDVKSVYEFTIAENGDTNVKPPDSTGNIGCDMRQGAWYLLIHGLHEGLAK